MLQNERTNVPCFCTSTVFKLQWRRAETRRAETIRWFLDACRPGGKNDLATKASANPRSSRENNLRRQHSMQLRSPYPGSSVRRDKTRCRYHTHERPELCGAHHMKEERPYCPSMLSKPFIYTQTCAILLILPSLYRELCPKWGESRQA